MHKPLYPIDPYQINENIFKLIGKDWMLIASGDQNHYNMMTASWGCGGILWNKPIAIIFVRPQRHTYRFLEENPYFTLNFFDESYREVLNLMGSKSGREINKMQVAHLSASQTSNRTVYFEQASLVLECKSIYKDNILPAHFLDDHIHKMYPQKDYHRFYIGEIQQVMHKE